MRANVILLLVLVKGNIMYIKNFILLVAANVSCAFILFLARYDENINVVQPRTTVEVESVKTLENINSARRVIEVDELEPQTPPKPEYIIEVSESDIESLMRIVEAEAGGEDINGKILVADVVINRVKSSSFPDTVTEVVYQKTRNITQFSPVSNGSINSVTISSDTREAVYSALCGNDISKGALYFMARKYSEPQSVIWFDTNLNFLFTYGNHDFFS
jgi:N-acetylmuramoyl-L-alanine amidase